MTFDPNAVPGTDLCTRCCPPHARCRHLQVNDLDGTTRYPCSVQGCHCPGGGKYITARMLPIVDTVNDGKLTGPMGPCKQPAPPSW